MRKTGFLFGLWMVLLNLVSPAVKAQPQNAENIASLQMRYWHYRYRQLNDFTVVGNQLGQSLVATRRSGDQNANASSEGALETISFGDATVMQGYYLGVLATEYALLVNNPNSTEEEEQTTLTELFFALEAVNRLDLVGELIYDNTFTGAVNNGFFTRNDVMFDFMTEESAGPGTPLNGDLLSSDIIGINSIVAEAGGVAAEMFIDNGPGQDPTPRLVPEGERCWGSYFNGEMSQDQFIGLTLGFALVVQSLPNAPIFLDNLGFAYNFHQETINTWERMLDWVATPPPGNIGMTCEWEDLMGATVADLQNVVIDQAFIEQFFQQMLDIDLTLPGFIGFNPSVNLSELDDFLIHNPVSEELVHRGANAQAFSFGLVKGFEEITGQNSGINPNSVAYSQPLFQAWAFPIKQDNDWMASVVGTVCDCWGVNTVNRLTLVGAGTDQRNWQNLYVPTYNYLHNANMNNIEDYTDDLFQELWEAPCEGPSYYAPLDPVAQFTAHRDQTIGNTFGDFNSDLGGWTSFFRYMKTFDKQHRQSQHFFKSKGMVSGMGYMLAHNMYLLNKDYAPDNYDSFFRNRIMHSSEETFPLVYIYNNGNINIPYIAGTALNPEVILSIESIRSTNTVGQGGSVAFQAGNNIDFLPGTWFVEGANVTANTGELDCAGNFLPADPGQPMASVGRPNLYERFQSLTYSGQQPLERQEGVLSVEDEKEEALIQENELVVFPNPTAGKVQLMVPGSTHYSLFNTLGAVVLTGNFIEGLNTIDLANLENGIYYLSTDNNPGVNTRIIKQ